MSDEILKKMKILLSGSKAKKEVKEDPQIVEDDPLSGFMSQILDSTWVEEELKNMAVPSYVLSKEENSYWLLNTQLKMLVNVKGGVEIIPIEFGEKDSICMIGHNVFKIPNKIMVYAGWN